MPIDKSIKFRFKQLKSHPRWVRIPLGILLLFGGLLGALPVLGFWMIPLGLLVLAADFHWARRLHVKLRLGWRRLRRRVAR